MRYVGSISRKLTFSTPVYNLLLGPRKTEFAQTFSRISFEAFPAPEKIWSKTVHQLLRYKIAPLGTAHFPSQIWPNALWVKSLVVFFVLEGQMTP